MAVDVVGLVALLVFYVLILAMGIWASKKSREEEKRCEGPRSEVTILGGRNINIWIGTFTMTATWVGAGYIMGTAETVYTPSRGLVWAVAPLAYVVTFLLGGLFFTKPMRAKRYVTMMDPFQRRYGNGVTTTLLLPILLCDLLWVALILSALGVTFSVMLGLSPSWSIVLSAAVAITYTLLGGLYSVAYTDVIQLLIFVVCLWLSVPFLLLNPTSSSSSSSPTSSSSYNTSQLWIGELKLEDSGKWMDEFLLLALGSLSYQVFYQRVLSAASPGQAQITCFASAIAVFVIGIPSVITGAVAATADWNQTRYGLPPPYERGEAANVLPLALQNLTPYWVSVLGIGGLTAAVMSSMDSVLLSCASMFTHNFYKNFIRKQASDRESGIVMRVSVLVAGIAGTGLAFAGESVSALWLLSGDLLYCMIFPQIVCVLYCRRANGYGAAAGILLGSFLRLLSGEPVLHMPPVLRFPGWREDGSTGKIVQYFPFRTLIMLLTLLVIPSVSVLSRLLFARHVLPPSWDVMGASGKEEEEEEEEEEGEEAKGGKGVNGVERAEVINLVSHHRENDKSTTSDANMQS